MDVGLAVIGVQVTSMDKESWKFLQELCDIPGDPASRLRRPD